MRFWTFALTFSTSLAPFAQAADDVKVTTVNGRRQCVVTARGNKQDDVPNIKKAFETCNKSATVVFPEGQTYWIGQKLNPVLEDVDIDWRGEWLYSDDMEYWRNHSYNITFQNHNTGFILTGKNIRVDGHGTGGINGNGDIWYTADEGNTTQGRPMPFNIWNVTDVSVKNFYVKQPQLWSINLMNGTNVLLENIVVSAKSTKQPDGENWVQNTDGLDTMDANHVQVTNFTYTGGDDCIALKSRSYNITVTGATCNGGNGIPIGSIGEYLEDCSVKDVYMSDLKVPGTRYGVYIKTWTGIPTPQKSYEAAGLPRGGGWGVVQNITFDNVDIDSADHVFMVDQNNGGNSSTAGTSKMTISDIHLKDFHGKASDNTATINCSKSHPCFDFYFTNMTTLKGSCTNVKSGTFHGLSGC
ncbi:hypothetical protein RU639_002288 [Aspergillus parasiticus]